MKRSGSLKRYWLNYDAFLEAWWEVKKNKSYFFTILAYEQNLVVNLTNLIIKLENGSYHPEKLRSFYVHDPKTRLIEAPVLQDRIVQHALLNVIRPIIEKKFIDHSYACRVNRGTHAASDQLKSYLVNYKNNGYYLKIDIEKFFYSIDHMVLDRQFRQIIKCEETLSLLKLFYKNETGKGLPLGNVTSQILANLSLNPLDHFIKRQLKFHHYIRYMDDMVILCDSKQRLLDALPEIENVVESLSLKMNNKTKISHIHEGIDFVGYKTWYNRRLIRKRSLYRIKRKLTQDANQNRVASFLSHAKRTNSIVYVIKQILSVAPDYRPWIEQWDRKHFKKPSS
jgi:RNA-directed DNA polymerase